MNSVLSVSSNLGQHSMGNGCYNWASNWGLPSTGISQRLLFVNKLVLIFLHFYVFFITSLSNNIQIYFMRIWCLEGMPF
jgi:hypothetical protein